MQFLPSGIRESAASDILIEFKKTESLNEDVVIKLSAYLLFYLENDKSVRREDVLPVIVSAKHPHKATLDRLGFVESDVTGVYQNRNALANKVLLLSLNRLPDTTYNAYFKLLASRRKTQERAVYVLREAGCKRLPIELTLFLATLWHYVFDATEDDPMIKQMTTDQMIEQGHVWLDLILKSMSPEDLLKKVDEDKLLDQIPTEKRLSGIPTEERLSGISADELEAFLHQLRQQEQSAEKD